MRARNRTAEVTETAAMMMLERRWWPEKGSAEESGEDRGGEGEEWTWQSLVQTLEFSDLLKMRLRWRRAIGEGEGKGGEKEGNGGRM